MAGPAVLGVADGQPTLTASGPAPELSASEDVLPELEEAVEAARPMWKHPAFVVSMILTLLALIAAGVFAALSIFGDGDAKAENAGIALTNDNAHLTWAGSGEMSLYAVSGTDAVDISQLIIADGEAWVPRALGLYDTDTCFVVRPANVGDEPVSLAADALAAQRATSVCASGNTVE